MSWFKGDTKNLKTEMTPKERAKKNSNTAQAFKNGSGEARDDIQRHQTPWFHWSKNHKSSDET